MSSFRMMLVASTAVTMAWGCGGTPDPPTEPPATGFLQLTISTTGVDLDPDGYNVTLDGTRAVAVPANAILTIPDLAAGSHTLALDGLTFNCVASSPASIVVTLGRDGGSGRFDVTCSRSFDLAYNYSNIRGEIRLTDPQGTRQRTLPATGRVTAWRPGGRSLTVARGLDLLLVNPDDGTEFPLIQASEGAFFFSNIRWAPDAHALLYEMVTLTPNAPRELFLLTLDGLVSRRIVPHGCEASWSPDSRRFVVKVPNVFEIPTPGLYVMNADGTNPTFLAVGHGAAWSPAGTDIVFSEGQTQCSGGGFQLREEGPLFLISPDGGNRRQLTFPAEVQFDEAASWSPDGTRLAFVRHGLPVVESGTAIFVINADGTGEHLVVNIPLPSGPQWSSDGQYLTTSNDRGVHIVSSEGGDLMPLPADIEGACCANWRPE